MATVIEVTAHVGGTIPAIDYGNIQMSVTQKATLAEGDDPATVRVDMLRACKATLEEQVGMLSGYKAGYWLKAVAEKGSEPPAPPAPRAMLMRTAPFGSSASSFASDESFSDEDFEDDDDDDFEDEDDSDDL